MSISLLLLPAGTALTDEIEGPVQYNILEAIHQPPSESDNVVLLALQPEADMRGLRQFHAQMIRLLADQKPSAIVLTLTFRPLLSMIWPLQNPLPMRSVNKSPSSFPSESSTTTPNGSRQKTSERMRRCCRK